MLCFACISPHPPLLLPTVGTDEDRLKVKNTLEALKSLKSTFREKTADDILISSPHTDWGFNVPLFFLAEGFRGHVKTYLTADKPPSLYFTEGRKVYQSTISNLKSEIAIIASGDLSHCLKEDGPYGFHPDGPKFDETLIQFLKKKNVNGILRLNDNFPNAAECGLRSFSFLLGILTESGLDWQPQILSYEGPFGVGYLVANFLLPSGD